MPARAHCLQHVPFEGLGSIEPWLAAAGYEVTTTRFFESAALPDAAGLDLIVAMGGPMSVNDEVELPWLVDEKRFIREAIAAGKPVLGVCLGAQLLASALGARVYRNPATEIGWFPVQGVVAGADAFRFPDTTPAFHWHGETFDLPRGAVRLARSVACGNQAFQFGRSVIGLQFHLETTPASVRELVENCRAELKPSAFVQSEAELLAAPVEVYRAINELMARVLSYLADRA